MFGYLAQRQMVIPKGLILPYYIAPESIESYIKSMPRSVEKDEYRTIYQTFLHIEPISSGLQEKHSVFIAALKNALPMVWKVSENVIQDLEVLAEKYKDTRSKPFILKFTDQSKVDIKGLFQAINQCSVRIIGLDFSSASAHLNSESIKPLAEELKHNKFITSLDLRWNKDIGVEGAKALAGMLKTNKTLVFLDLGWNFIGVEGARALAEALKTNKSLVFLDLFRNEIGDEGAKSISEALKINTTLTLLDLEFNEIGAQGARALAEVLEMNETFTSLNLFNNPIGSEGIKDITEVLKTNTTLTSLNWGYNKDGDSGSKAIQDMLQINKMIKVTYQCGWSQPCLQYWLFMKWGI